MVRTQVRVTGTRKKFHRPRHKKILDGYDKFNTYVIVGSLRATTNFRRSDVRHHVMTSEASRLVSRLYHNNKNRTASSTLFVPYLRESYRQLLSQIEQLKKFRILILCAPNDQNQSFLLMSIG